MLDIAARPLPHVAPPLIRRYSALDIRQQRRPLDYVTPRHSRPRRMHRGYLLVTLLCFALSSASWLIAGQHAGVLLPISDPPPANDPYWKNHSNDEGWFFAGACTMPVFGLLGLLFLYGTFAARPRDGGETAAE